LRETNPLIHDLNFILEQTSSLWEALRNQRLFITGGTGFFGCWLLESFIHANTQLNLNAHATILTRNIDAFSNQYPHLFHHPFLKFIEGDVRHFTFPQNHFSHIIHAATQASATLNQTNPALMLDTIIQGTLHTLEFARHCGASCFLLTSSGAIYGKQPSHISHLPEDYLVCHQPNDPLSAYALGKRTAEHLCNLYAHQFGLNTKIARCFAFVGPYLPLNLHYAIGNFIRDGLQGGPILVNSDGTSFRSYLYAADLVVWLWTILFRGKINCLYNVGSGMAITIAELASLIAHTFDTPAAVKIIKTPSNQDPDRYVPSIKRIQQELGLTQRIGLSAAIKSTIRWHALKLLSKNPSM